MLPPETLQSLMLLAGSFNPAFACERALCVNRASRETSPESPQSKPWDV